MKIVLIGLICILWVQKASSAPKWSSNTPDHSTDDHGLNNTDSNLLIMDLDYENPDFDETGPLVDGDSPSTDWEGDDLCFDGNRTIWEDDFTDHRFRSEGPMPSKNTDACPSWMKTANRLIAISGSACFLKVLYAIRKKQAKLAKNRSKTIGKSVPTDEPGEIGEPYTEICQPKETYGPEEDEIQQDAYFSQGLTHSRHGTMEINQDISMAASEADSGIYDELIISPRCFVEDTEIFPQTLDLDFGSSFRVISSESEEFPGFEQVDFEELDLQSFTWEDMEQEDPDVSQTSAMAAFLYSDVFIKKTLESEEIPVLDKTEAEKPGDTKSPSKSACQVNYPFLSELELLFCPFMEPLDWDEISRQMTAENVTEVDPEIMTILNEESSAWGNQQTSERGRELDRNSAMSAFLYSDFAVQEARKSEEILIVDQIETKSSPNRSCQQIILPSPHERESCPFMEPLNWNEISRQMVAENDTADDPEIMRILNFMEDVSGVSIFLRQTPYPEFAEPLDNENQPPSDATPQLMKTDDEKVQVKPNSPLGSDTVKTRRPDDMMDDLRLKDQLLSSSLQKQTFPDTNTLEIDYPDIGDRQRLIKQMIFPSPGCLQWTSKSHLDQMSSEEQRSTKVFGIKPSVAKKVSFSDEVTVKTLFLRRRRSSIFVPKLFRKKVDIRMIEDIHIHPLKGDREENPFKLLKRSRKIISLLLDPPGVKK